MIFRVSINLDTRLPNTAMFTVQREDHTLGNVLSRRMQQEPHVLYAGYRVPHPLEHVFCLKIQTENSTTPIAALQQGIDNLISDLSVLEDRFKAEVRRFSSTVPRP